MDYFGFVTQELVDIGATACR
uniref:Uncharacterized protein n=1 Tax=Arundo donax TaxID=35708 RepID=A0A0A9TXJ2_ARUDO